MKTAKTARVTAIVLAGGSSTRMKGIDKLSADLCGKPILARTLEAFEECHAIDDIVLVANKEKIHEYSRIVRKGNFSKLKKICIGGERRQDSVASGLRGIGQCDYVVVHDADRPFVTPDMIKGCVEAASETGAAIAAVPATDTIKISDKSGMVRRTPQRKRLWVVQTPQVFLSKTLKRAHARIKDDVTDDSSMVEKLGNRVKLFMGSYNNIKITNPSDLAIATIMWSSRNRKNNR
jgi:2-C-methyl-D-erythritol 4-phosphate cytidylyltransferase